MLLMATAKQPPQQTCKEERTLSRLAATPVALIAMNPRHEDKESWPACMQSLN